MAEKQFFGHPRGLSTLFFTELWERFSYYGMRALLVLFMTAAASEGGLGMGNEQAGAIYGLYTFGVYALALPGGWIADRLTGKRKAVLYGGVLIALGHYALAVPALSTFYLGLFLVVLGTGLLKPNVSAIVGDLYGDDGARRDAGFSLFYMGINVGAFLGPIICSPLAEDVDWHLGFGAAGVGMTLALVQYVLGQKHLKGAGELGPESATPERLASARKTLIIGLVAFAAILIGVYSLIAAGTISLFDLGKATGIVVLGIVVIYFLYILAFECRDATERKRIGVCFFLFLGAAMFWSGFEQAGSSMNLFARDHTDRGLFGIEIATGVLQAVNPMFIIIMAPVIGMLWLKLAERNPSIPVKFGAGLILLGAGFFVLAWGSTYVDPGKVGMSWLVVTYFLHTVGELCLSPVGLSSTTKLAPDRLVGQMMGIWFMGSAIGNLIAGLVAGYIEAMPLPQLFGTVAAIVVGAGLLFLIFSVPIRKMCAGVN